MHKRVLVVMSFLAGMLLFVGCGDSAAKTPSISGKVGQNFVISLDSNPTTGYEWTPVYDQVILKLVSGEYKAASNPQGLVGAGGQQVFTFSPIKSGETLVKMVYKRPWEQDAAETRLFIVTIN
jgi:inhibitor of cysteine peptidase